MGVTLEWLLECAVVMSWIDLLQSDKPGLIHVDYCFSANGSVDSLKLWLSTVRGHWRLVCEYGMTMAAHHQTVVRFEQGYQSAGLVRNLEFIMRHQNRFQLALNHGRHGFLLVCAPTQQETETASATMAAAHLQVNSVAAQLSA